MKFHLLVPNFQSQLSIFIFFIELYYGAFIVNIHLNDGKDNAFIQNGKIFTKMGNLIRTTTNAVYLKELIKKFRSEPGAFNAPEVSRMPDGAPIGCWSEN
jgi:hypothetical protein